MDVKVTKKLVAAYVVYIPNVHAIVELPERRVRIVGTNTCECCGATKEVYVEASFDDTIELIPTLK